MSLRETSGKTLNHLRIARTALLAGAVAVIVWASVGCGPKDTTMTEPTTDLEATIVARVAATVTAIAESSPSTRPTSTPAGHHPRGTVYDPIFEMRNSPSCLVVAGMSYRAYEGRPPFLMADVTNQCDRAFKGATLIATLLNGRLGIEIDQARFVTGWLGPGDRETVSTHIPFYSWLKASDVEEGLWDTVVIGLQGLDGEPSRTTIRGLEVAVVSVKNPHTIEYLITNESDHHVRSLLVMIAGHDVESNPVASGWQHPGLTIGPGEDYRGEIPFVDRVASADQQGYVDVVEWSARIMGSTE